MNEPTLNYVTCQGAASHGTADHRMAYWEWNQTGNAAHPHVIVCVHGLTRQGRDFDVLARLLSQHARVICPDVVGRGQSNWLADPLGYGIPQYAQDMLALLHQVHGAMAIEVLDWVGTSMGGLIGMCLAGGPNLPMPVPIRKLLLNDVGPALEWPALQRIAGYVGNPFRFVDEQQAVNALKALSIGFGPHTEQAWLDLSRPMLKCVATGGVELHYDPAIAQAVKSMTRSQAELAQEQLWKLYDSIQAQTLLVRGAMSDLISQETAREMQGRGPCATLVELEGVGHAPTFVAVGQVAIARQFLLGDE